MRVAPLLAEQVGQSAIWSGRLHEVLPSAEEVVLEVDVSTSRGSGVREVLLQVEASEQSGARSGEVGGQVLDCEVLTLLG